MADWAEIAAHISTASGQSFHPASPTHLGGGCINTAVVLEDDGQGWFVKLNSDKRLPMFEAEAAGLAELAASNTLNVPEPLCTGVSGAHSYIVMTRLRLGAGSSKGFALAGELLAEMHRHSASEFGWQRENTIGSTRQCNRRNTSWIDFWHEQRLGFQLQLAAGNGYASSLQDDGERLLENLHLLLDHDPQPSLLHGDLWGGNLSFSADGRPTIYDPATYFGDREAELAMTELFGGFSSNFYAAYNSSWKLEPGYRVRKDLYNLYHVLNHLNMFGSGYLGQARSLMARLLGNL